MAVEDGVIKFKYDLTEQRLPLDLRQVRFRWGLDRWRDILFEHNLIGQDPTRYDGMGFGNVSERVRPTIGKFLITATQTGGLPVLDLTRHYVVVTAYDLDQNYVEALGLTAPSSEAMTHASVYDYDPSIQAVFHAHTPVIWEATNALGIPAIREDVEYGTPDMAREVRRLFEETDAKQRGIFSMRGHRDGIMTFGATLDQAGSIMLRYLDRSKGIRPQLKTP